MELIPIHEAIPVVAGWFELFMIPAFMIHLLLMNIMVGGSIIAFLHPLLKPYAYPPKPEISGNALAQDIAEKLPFVISLAINFGVASLLFLQVLYGQFIYVSSQLMAVLWLFVIILLMAAYSVAYHYKFNFDKLNDSRHLVIGIAAILFLSIAFLFCNNMTLMLNPSSWNAYFENSGGTMLNLADPTLLPRYLHFITASLAIGGLFSAIVWTLKKNHPASEDNIAAGMNWFVYATITQIAVGFWFQMSLPKEIAGLFMGADKFHTILFLTSMVLVAAAIFSGIHRKVWTTTGVTLLLVLLMVLMRNSIRTAYLKPGFMIADLHVQAQYSPMIFFALSLFAGVALVVYVIRVAMKPA